MLKNCNNSFIYFSGLIAYLFSYRRPSRPAKASNSDTDHNGLATDLFPVFSHGPKSHERQSEGASSPSGGCGVRKRRTSKVPFTFKPATIKLCGSVEKAVKPHPVEPERYWHIAGLLAKVDCPTNRFKPRRFSLNSLW